MDGRHYWEIIADQLKAKGWSIGWAQFIEDGFLLWTVDARKDGYTHVSKAEDLNTAFVELEVSIREVSA